jgi:hypothetical protein
LKRLSASLAAIACAVLADVSLALPGTFSIEQIYSNADGTIQFVVIHDRGANDCDSGENQWAGQTLISAGSAPARTFVFPTDLSSCRTSDRRMLIATEGFAALGLVAPDYVIPNGFIQIPSGRLVFADVSSVSYNPLPDDGVHAIDRSGAPIQNVATNFAGASASVPAILHVRNYQGLWWASPAASESGWGINFAHQGDVIFATWFTYNASGKALWMTMIATRASEGVYGGTLYQTHGPAFSATPFKPTAVATTEVGTATLTFSDESNGSFAYTVNGIQQTKAITREIFGPLPVCTYGGLGDLSLATNYQDLWWASPPGAEAGWGVNFTHQGDTIFATWFTYDADGSPLWLVSTAQKTGAGIYTGTLYRTTGPAFNAVPFLPANVAATPVGTLALTFHSGNSATFAYTVNGVTQSKPIVRQVFDNPGTACR